MLSTTKVSRVEDVPVTWIFEYYTNCPEKLTGQNVKMKSIFNSTDKNPSFCIYVHSSSGNYKYKDFSADKQGDSLDLVKELFNLESRNEASHKIISDYNKYLTTNKPYVKSEIKNTDNFKIVSYKIRGWTTIDRDFWLQFHIGSSLLKKYNVVPLKSFTLKRKVSEHKFTVEKLRMYGFFTKKGKLYKIYQPGELDNKFFKVFDYYPGQEHLEYKADCLIIVSSLKDLMAFEKLKIPSVELMVPDSENTIIPKKIINKLKKKYKYVLSLFDNDEAGIKAMVKYKKEYNISGILVKLEKDIADNNKEHGLKTSREITLSSINNKLKEIKHEQN